jgi:integrative and conjugative element protein (TIGR02256 family)
MRRAITAPEIRILAATRDRICELAVESRDGFETGGILLGRGSEADGAIVVERAGDAGPKAERRPDYFLRDLAHAQWLADEAWADDQAVWVGEWHTHPTGILTPSPRDLVTYAGLLTDPELAFNVFVSIIVVPDPDWARPKLLTWALGGPASRPLTTRGTSHDRCS